MPSPPPAPAHPAPSPARDQPLAKRVRPDADAPDMADMAKPLPSLPPMASFVADAPAAPLSVKLLDPAAKAPTRGSAFAAGYDMYASAAATVPKHGRALVSTGIAVAVPPGTYARVAPRSGLAVKHGIATGAGVVDEDYRGEIKVVLFNHGDEDFEVSPGDRVAQLVLERIVTPDVVVVEELADSVRGAGGFGSTGA